mgnify:CR=1 FL=1
MPNSLRNTRNGRTTDLTNSNRGSEKSLPFNTFKTMKDIIDELFKDFYANAEIAALNEEGKISDPQAVEIEAKNRVAATLSALGLDESEK